MRTSFVIKRLLLSLLTYIVINLFTFTIPRLMPGNYVDYLASSRFLPPEAVKELYRRFGLDQPLHIQFLNYLKNVMFSLKPDFGYSYSFYPLKAWDVVLIYMPWTILLLSIATITTFVLGVILGFLAARWKDEALDRIIMGFSLFTMSNPYFVLAMILLLIFSQYLRIFPPGGAYSPTVSPGSIDFVVDVIRHMALPLIALSIGTSGQYIILTRSIIINNMTEDYFRAAEAIGIKRSKILIEYALRPGVLPLITLFGIRFGTMLSGALLTEIIFSYPGLGYVLYQAILSKDFPVIQAIFYMICLMVIIVSLVLDLIYGFLDPRIRRG
ncbi:MAG: ABC transporter permease [Desulfurococcaceae archaeon]|nr:ABC transporter permease [Desulfurococcaceae archaeon]